MKLRILALTLFTVMYSCKEEKPTVNEKTIVALDNLFTDFHEFKLEINPLEATRSGDGAYNDYLPNYISDAHQQKLVEKLYRFFGAYCQY